MHPLNPVEPNVLPVGWSTYTHKFEAEKPFFSWFPVGSSRFVALAFRAQVAADMMKEAWLLCFDEFQVTHISPFGEIGDGTHVSG